LPLAALRSRLRELRLWLAGIQKLPFLEKLIPSHGHALTSADTTRRHHSDTSIVLHTEYFLYRGSGSQHSYRSQNHQSDYRPHLEEDLKHKYTVTFDEFLNDILNLAPDWIIKNASQISNIVKSQSFKKMVSKYCKERHETSRYPPFIDLGNDVMRQLGGNPNSESDMCFCRNDPVIVGGPCAHRKPDVAGVRRQSLEVEERMSVDNLMKDGPNSMRFSWTELLSFFEFKLIHKELSLPTSEDLDGVTRDRSLSTFIAGFPSFFRAFMTAMVLSIANSLVRAPPITPQPSDELAYPTMATRFRAASASHFSFGAKAQLSFFKCVPHIKEAKGGRYFT
jgi:hypothetical protein